MATKFRSKLLYGKTGFFDSVGIGVPEPGAGLYISGADFRIDSGNAYFQYRPSVSGYPVMLSGDTISIDVSDLYPANNPSGFITGIAISEIEDVGIDNAVSGQTLVYNGFSWENSDQSSPDNIDLLFKNAFATYYHEFAYSSSSDLTGINVWDSDSKGSYLFSKEFSYSGDLLTGISITDKVNNNTLTKTLSYDGNDNLISTTRIYT